jgi:asparagine synthase (glutamine-hydrolysing)
MVASMVHRGPDDQGVWSNQEPAITLGHCRLSILDLSDAGHQPMGYARGRLWTTFNGEIYNYLEIRAELEGKGYEFRSRTDTEVLLAAYAQWGVECLDRFRGMFAFAIADLDPPSGGPELFLARDRLGIKPLLVARKGDKLWFASELRAILASGAVDRRVDPEALLDYLAVGAVFQPRTIVADTKALAAGSYLALRGGASRAVRYWDLHENTSMARERLLWTGADEAAEELRAEMERATRYHMVADVPVGAFLSGGVDSTAVVGLMSRLSGKAIRTYCVGFDRQDSQMDERPFARLAARHLHADHHEEIAMGVDAEQVFPKIVECLDQPSLDGTNTWIVSRAARRDVIVALSGLGGDEIFAGYEHFSWFEEPHWRPPFHRAVKATLEAVHRVWPGSPVYRMLFRVSSEAQRLSMLRRLLADYEIAQLTNRRWSSNVRQQLADHHVRWTGVEGDSIQRASYGEVNGYLVSTLLRDVDAMSMAHSLEVRPVLLDHKVVELGYALPARHKRKEGKGKIVLTAAMREYLPGTIVNREKVGFEVPFSSWMRGRLRQRLFELLESTDASRIFEAPYLKYLRSSLGNGQPPRALWAWGILLAWLQLNQITLM